MGDDHRLTADAHPMPELHEVIDDHAVFHHGVLERAAIDRRVGSDFNIVANHHRRELLDFHPTLCAGRVAKTISTDRCVGVDRAALANFHRVTDHRTGLDHRISTDARAMANVSTRANPDAISKHRVRLHAGACINGDISTQTSAVCNRGLLMDLSAARRMVIEDPGCFGKRHIRRVAQ